MGPVLVSSAPVPIEEGEASGGGESRLVLFGKFQLDREGGANKCPHTILAIRSAKAI
ncbi:MAG: hypothetical protein JWN63_2658 [Candidatus Acidoferrum typicum]|jgi:hypothetical protein|nr:hypothetical protein [Candidatus Acidoferrum typicum]